MAYAADLCGSKLRGKLGAVLNESATNFSPALLSSDKSFAKRQLEKMGWTEGTGLGKRRDGMKEHVKIKQREDEMGLGREKMKAQEVADVWWKDNLGDTLARLQKKKSDKDEKKSKKKSKKDKKKEKTKKHFTDEELFKATGGARFGSTSGARANRSQHGKWKRSESGHELTELEKKAKESMEWNGRGNAQVLSSKESSATLGGESDVSIKKDAEITSMKEDDAEASMKEDDKSKKKKRKLEKKESKRAKKAKIADDDDVHAVSPPPSEEEEVQAEEVKPAKKAKKNKKKKSKQ
ncbi:hypothetical protein QTG54_008805 [Skeletonema marinoi]|uniref:G-patch domain-containing protein n=1 Tax=Skeletonema marinoi TaxID=267567 RepID=A0A7S2KRW1_9STRA|nr:hypothetical protein QTG54_008805 [Skeletonema marinoi]|mmetsp:Transcript_10842/g.18498  ORF Transcript_10842/g.18498 Transcript_10842/m.18498 type:complete len:294 (-) Transcript_10842:41-922(-)